jgi:hypothetical protein
MNYVIENVIDPELLWSNGWGWTDGDDFDVFSLQEMETLNLPIEGKWIGLLVSV